MRTTIAALAVGAALVSAQSSITSINVGAIEVPIPTSVFVLPVVYVTKEGAPTLTATTLASTATPSSDAAATNVFDSAAKVSAAVSSASVAAAASTGIAKRDNSCVQQPLGISYNSVPDTAAAFAADTYYGAKAVAAGTPSGYVQTFQNLNASNSADQYMGYTLLSSYDVQSCVSKCSAISGCNSANIYFERDPSVDPGAGCVDPASTIQVKCVFWGGAITTANANNFGQWRETFQVLVAGSNGYVNSTYASALAASKTATSSAAVATTTNAAGNIYTLYFSSDSNSGAYSSVSATSSYTDCTAACDADSRCNAFTYVGGANGVGSGTCWLKTALGNPTSAGGNYLSGTRSGKASTSSLSSSSTALVIPTTLSTITKSVSSTSSSKATSTTVSSSTASSTTTSATSSLSTPFYINVGNSRYVQSAAGSNGGVTYNSGTSVATKYQIDTKTGYLVEYTGSTGYAASMPQGANTVQKLLFNPTGSSTIPYIKCSQNTGSGWLECSTNGVGQYAFTCSSDNNAAIWFGPNIPSTCSWVGLYYQSTSA